MPTIIAQGGISNNDAQRNLVDNAEPYIRDKCRTGQDSDFTFASKMPGVASKPGICTGHWSDILDSNLGGGLHLRQNAQEGIIVATE